MPEARRRGVGRELGKRLLEHPALKEQHIHSILAKTTSTNAGSVMLALRGNFKALGTLNFVFCKFGRWYDRSVFQLSTSHVPPNLSALGWPNIKGMPLKEPTTKAETVIVLSQVKIRDARPQDALARKLHFRTGKCAR